MPVAARYHQTRAYLASRKAKGLCIDCPKPTDPHHVRCEDCRWSLKRARLAKLDAGLCGMCGKVPSREGRTTCGPCADRAKASHRKYTTSKRRPTCTATEPVVASDSERRHAEI